MHAPTVNGDLSCSTGRRENLGSASARTRNFQGKRDAHTTEVEKELNNTLCWLLERYGNQEEGSEERLVAWLRDFVASVVNRSIRDSSSADDAAQEIVLKFHERNLAAKLLKISKNGDPPCYFLVRVVSNAVTDVARKIARRSKREIAFFPGSPQELDLADEADDPCQRAMRNEQTTAVHDLLLALGETDRQLVLLHYGFLGRREGYVAIAERLGIKEEAAKKRGYRAILTLRKALRHRVEESCQV
jgi:RNA polymerase sigma factor (sigma-70 family)